MFPEQTDPTGPKVNNIDIEGIVKNLPLTLIAAKQELTTLQREIKTIWEFLDFPSDIDMYHDRSEIIAPNEKSAFLNKHFETLPEKKGYIYNPEKNNYFRFRSCINQNNHEYTGTILHFYIFPEDQENLIKHIDQRYRKQDAPTYIHYSRTQNIDNVANEFTWGGHKHFIVLHTCGDNISKIPIIYQKNNNTNATENVKTVTPTKIVKPRNIVRSFSPKEVILSPLASHPEITKIHKSLFPILGILDYSLLHQDSYIHKGQDNLHIYRSFTEEFRIEYDGDISPIAIKQSLKLISILNSFPDISLDKIIFSIAPEKRNNFLKTLSFHNLEISKEINNGFRTIGSNKLIQISNLTPLSSTKEIVSVYLKVPTQKLPHVLSFLQKEAGREKDFLTMHDINHQSLFKIIFSKN